MERVKVQFSGGKKNFFCSFQLRKVTEDMWCVYFSGNFGDRYFGTDDY